MGAGLQENRFIKIFFYRIKFWFFVSLVLVLKLPLVSTRGFNLIIKK